MIQSCQVKKSSATATSRSSSASRGKSRVERLPKPKATTSAQTSKLIKEARKWIGTPYRYGGTSRSGVDCSGLIMELYLKVYDMKLPRSSGAQQEFCVPVGRDDLEPGDLVFFATTSRRNVVSHVGLYIGSGRMIHASGSRGVMESGLDEAYFKRTYYSAGRVVQAPAEEKKKLKTDAPVDKQKKIPVPEIQEVTALDSLELIIEQQIDSIYVSDPFIFD